MVIWNSLNSLGFQYSITLNRQISKLVFDISAPFNINELILYYILRLYRTKSNHCVFISIKLHRNKYPQLKMFTIPDEVRHTLSIYLKFYYRFIQIIIKSLVTEIIDLVTLLPIKKLYWKLIKDFYHERLLNFRLKKFKLTYKWMPARKIKTL